MLAAGERLVRVPPQLMAAERRGGRERGKSDPIDALAVARAALRHPDLPTAHLDGPSRDVRLLVDHREDLVAERTRMINRLRWHLHELDPDLELPTRLNRYTALDRVSRVLTQRQGTVATIAAELVERIRELTGRINELERDLHDRIGQLAPTLVARTGCGHLTAAKIVAETADITRFRSRDGYAAHNGTAPLPVWSGNRYRHRLSRVGNVNSTLPSTASRSPRYASTRSRRPISTAPWPTARPRPKPSDCSSAAYPTPSTAIYAPTPNPTDTASPNLNPTQLDIGARLRAESAFGDG